jgi:hypothetical protein
MTTLPGGVSAGSLPLEFLPPSGGPAYLAGS